MCVFTKGNKDGCAGFVQRAHCPGKNEIQIHTRAIKYELYNFGDSKRKFNAATFAFKTGFADIKMNGKIHANHLKFRFFFT